MSLIGGSHSFQWADLYKTNFVAKRIHRNPSNQYSQSYDIVCQFALLGDKGLSNNDDIKYFQRLSIARVDWRLLSNKNDILQSCDNLFQYAKSRHIYNTRYASKQNFCKPCIPTTLGNKCFPIRRLIPSMISLFIWKISVHFPLPKK